MKLLTSGSKMALGNLPVPKFFDPGAEAAAILFPNVTAACQADDTSPTWEGRGVAAAFINIR